MIDEVLNKLMNSVSNQLNYICLYVKTILEVMKSSELMEMLSMKFKISFSDNYLNPAIVNVLVNISLPNSLTSKNQTYYEDQITFK